ncbi:MAG: potassium/proton antiporter [Oscillospiraceae bacterium]|nr:potassium/proton antiporter [Oscillospiraceae bacterium]
MNLILLFGGILIVSVLSCKITNKTGLPVLVGFILIGAFIGRKFDFLDVANAERICNYALLFIIFAGGFQTDFKRSKPVLTVSATLATVGVVLTAAAVAAFAYFVLNIGLYAAILLGAVMSPTDAASVFSVLSSKKLNLKNNLGQVLEMESGSNDPLAYMLTIVFLAIATGESVNVPLLLVMQILIGASIGFAAGMLGRRMINKLNLEIDGIYSVLICGIAMFIYGLTGLLHGNGFLAVYIGGIVLGSGKIVHKTFLSKTCGSVSMLMQIVLFIVLGILWIPSSFVSVLISGLLFAVFLIFIIRPSVVFLLMKPFGYKLKEISLVSWAGFRGASSIVFSTYLLAAKLAYAEYIFSVVFFVCLLSVILQGSFLAPLAKRLGLTDDSICE